MHKEQIIDYIAKKSGGKVTKRQAELVLDLFSDGIVDTLERGEKFQLVNIFSVEPVGRKSRNGFNPLLKERVVIDPKVGLRIKPGKRLKGAITGLDVKDFLNVPEQDEEDDDE